MKLLNWASCLTIFAAALLLAIPDVQAQSAAARNNEGNRLFEQGKYEEAEKAYLEAQVENPGKPELLYNLGNSLIKQNRYDQATQSLHQAIGKGNKGIQQNSWYNIGNALFSQGNFKDSAQAYIQALRINPTDRDAKHNLELALQKIQQQNQMSRSGSQSQDQQKSDESQQSSQQSEESDQNQQLAADESPPKLGDNDQQSSPKQPEKSKPENQQAAQADETENSFSKEQAIQILDAIQNQELAEQRKLLERSARRKATGKDW